MDILIIFVGVFSFLVALAWAYKNGKESVIDDALLGGEVEAYGKKWSVSARQTSI